MKEKYDWTFSTIGGITRVNINSGDDIRHLNELDQKLWTVLSCPVKGLEMDEKSLQYLDTDNDGRIHVNDVVATSDWLVKVVVNPDLLLEKKDAIKLRDFNLNTDEGKKLHASAKQILANLGLKKDNIALADTEDNVAIFAKTALNGDGIVTVQSSDDKQLVDTIDKMIATVGSKTDRSGLPGVDEALVNEFYAELSAYSDWIKKSDAEKTLIFPFGEDTAKAHELIASLKAKIEDYFMRCKLSAFNEESQKVLDVQTGRIEEVSVKDLSACNDEIAQYPLARLDIEGRLPLDGHINPVWKSAFDSLKAIAFDNGAKYITEDDWNALLGRMSAYEAWLSAKAGAKVESLGIETVNKLTVENRKDDILKLIEDDKALESESTSIEQVNKLLHLYRDFYTLLCNFVSFKDFYNPQEKAIFQAGSLFIDERCCDLCVKVDDMGPHNATAALSGMFIVYCNCVSKSSAATMTIAAAMTDGDISDLREGKHGIFYDRQGGDWDATIFKIIDNPISVRQAFWSPYRKLGKLVEDAINKFASDKDSKVTGDMTAAVADPKEGKTAFDIAKFTGIFAAITLGVGALMTALAKIFDVLKDLSLLQWLGLIVGVILIISGPAMIKAWLILRKRNLSPLLNANGWAINAAVKVNITFGSTLTAMPKAPKIAVGVDPFADKTPIWKKILAWFAIIAVVFALLYFNEKLDCIGLHYEKLEKLQKKAQVECTVPATTVESVAVEQ